MVDEEMKIEEIRRRKEVEKEMRELLHEEGFGAGFGREPEDEAEAEAD